jgi:hypothetical protein
LLIVVLFDFLNIKSVKIYAIPFIFSTTLLLYKLDTLLLFGLSLCKIVRSSVILLLPLLNITYSAIETKEVARIGYNGILFPHLYSGDGLGATSAFT